MPEYSPVQLESFVQSRAPQIAQDIILAAKNSQNEADLVAQVEKLVDRFADSFDLQLHLQRERTLVNGRADAVYNRLVIEYEPPRSLNKSNSHRNNQHAIQQVKDYMGGLERLDRHKKERLAGVVLDGGFYIFVRYREDSWYIDDPLPVTTQSTETFLRYLLSLSTEKALTPENLVRDFGENSNVARQVVPVLYTLACYSGNKKVETIFQQWERQFREISGYDPSSGQLDTAELAKLYAVKVKEPNLERLFFAIHSYYAAFIKLLALQVAHYYLMPKTSAGLKAAAGYEKSQLWDYLKQLEEGGLFKELKIRNFLEGDFFGWYLEVWDDSTTTAMKRLIVELADYSLVTLDVDPEDTRDLLKQLYQNLMPKKLRHALGEYYTPDWLADRLLSQLGYEGDPFKRLLDPACGSGTFLVLALKRIRKYAEDKKLHTTKVLEHALANVIGFDLNPLAVISARTNYLLALGDLLENREGEISIPVYLADSILTPSLGTDLFTQHGYSFNTAIGRFTVPRSLVRAHYIDQLADLLEQCVHNVESSETFREKLIDTFPLESPKDNIEIDLAVELFQQLIRLEAQGINGIWARIIKNAFAPLFQDRFDFIAGNPPWVNWESLPKDYREETINLWEQYRLLPLDRAGTRQKSQRSKTDISLLMLIVSVDKYLYEKGKLGFVITQSIYKTERGGRGFRQHLANRSPFIKVEYVDDLSELQVFEGASNRTSVLILRKGSKTDYPIQYGYWRKIKPGISIAQEFTLSEAMKHVKVLRWIAKPISSKDVSSPWITGRVKAIDAISKTIGQSYYYDLCREGSNTRGANGVFWVHKLSTHPNLVVMNLPENGRLSIDSVQGNIETDLLYPLLRGQEVSRWGSSPESWIIVPHSPSQPSIAIPSKTMQLKYPQTYQFLLHFKDVLQARGQFRNFNPLSDEFYGLYNIGSYSFAPYKVVWREQSSDLSCTVIDILDGKPIIPDHKLMSVPISDFEEANYLCACLNNSVTRLAVMLYSIEIQISTHILKYISIPKFDPTNPVHLQLSELSIMAHNAFLEDSLVISQIENKIDQLVKELWGLYDGELIEIHESFKELNRGNEAK